MIHSFRLYGTVITAFPLSLSHTHSFSRSATSPQRMSSRQHHHPSGSNTTGSSGDPHAFIGFMHQRSSQDARMERLVAASSRSLGEGVQQIVMAAKAKTQAKGEWKEQLVQLLTTGAGSASEAVSDVDVLLENSSCEKFLLRCVENELPPNLVHCLRLLRVLELQHAADHTQDRDIRPLGEQAARKVAKLLSLLCTDPVVGEQLRPHLFGLLALSGASYPPTGVHVARAASEVIVSLAEFCLSRQLIFFIHDRKMILHMTDDIKELCGMVEATGGAPAVPNGLTEGKAEEAGLWAIACRTVVMLVSFSCQQQTVDLVKDFEAAGGFKVLRFAINRSTRKYGKELLELLPVLACCPNEAEEKDFDGEDDRLATNISAFDTMEDFLHRSNPLLHAYRAKHDGDRPDLDVGGTLEYLAQLSIDTAAQLRLQNEPFVGEELNFDIAPDFLDMTLKIFSDHLENYDNVEGRLHTLMYWLLALPCIHDRDTKIFILKMLEFVLTSVGVSSEVMPVYAIIEIFFVLCKTVFQGGESLELSEDQRITFLQILSDEISLIGETLEKLLQFDQRVAPVMIESGILTSGLNEILELITLSLGDYTDGQLPPEDTGADATLGIACKVLKLLVSHQPTDVPAGKSDSLSEKTSLHQLLRIATKQMGLSACYAAAGVFESYMASFSSIDGLIHDMSFVFDLVKHLASLNHKLFHGSREGKILDRQAVLLSTVRNVLEGRSLARQAFKESGGFDVIIDVMLSLSGGGEQMESLKPGLMSLFQSIISLVEASVGTKSKSPLSNTDSTPLLLPSEFAVDQISSAVSSQSPAALNLNYIRQSLFYLHLAAAVAQTGALSSSSVRKEIIEVVVCHIDPALSNEGEEVTNLRNPDGIRFLLSFFLFYPDDDASIEEARTLFDRVLSLTEKECAPNTLSQISCTGIVSSLTSSEEFAPVLFCDQFPLKEKYLEFLKRIASFCASERDVLSLLRCMAGPAMESPKTKSVRLPYISSSINRKAFERQSSIEGYSNNESETERLQVLKDVARESDRYFRLRVGGDSINTIGVLMHKVKLEERLRAAAETGRLKYLEVECLDSSSLSNEPLPSSPPTSPSSAERVWSPLSGSGFTYSVWIRLSAVSEDLGSGNLYVLDISSPSLSSSSNQTATFLTIWYDLQNQRFNVMSSTAYRMEPICFPVSPLVRNIWHHVMVTYNPAKRSVISRKAVFSLYVDGRPLEADVRVDSPPLPPNSKVLIGSPNPALAASGIVRGKLPVWEMGPCLLLSTVLLDLDATALFSYGPTFPGLVWGDRPERDSLPAIATSLFSVLADTGELGSISTALRRRDISKLESAGHALSSRVQDVGLSSVSLNCQVTPECVVFAFQASTLNQRIKNGPNGSTSPKLTQRLVNLARSAFDSENVSTDALVCGKGSHISPRSFSDTLGWIGGPMVLMPVINSASSPDVLAGVLDVMRTCVRRHHPNLEAMQGNGGYRVLAVLLQEKTMIDERCLDQCLAFAIHGFDTKPPRRSEGKKSDDLEGFDSIHSSLSSDKWIFVDVDAMKHLVLNHQVWDLRKFGPSLPLRILSALNRIVDHVSLHKAFNARRLHMVGIVKWCIHIMIEASELYTSNEGSLHGQREKWSIESSTVSDVLVGGEPGNKFLKSCKTLLRRILTFMLTPGDLESLAQATIFTVTTLAHRIKGTTVVDQKLHPFPTMRLYLIRLLEELVVDGVNEIIVSSSSHSTPRKEKSQGPSRDNVPGPHSAGVASPGQPYLTSLPRKSADSLHDVTQAKHTQAQAFLSAFTGYLTPNWFATLLEGCRDEATASAALRLMILMLQASNTFESSFFACGSFVPFVISLPKFSASPGIILPLLSYLFRVPILHIHSLPSLDAEQLCEIFDSESDDNTPFERTDMVDPAGGVVSVIVECLGRNAEIGKSDEDDARGAREANRAIFALLHHRIESSAVFRDYCTTSIFLEPMVQALCLSYQVDRTGLPSKFRSRKRQTLSDVPRDLTPIERYVGPKESDADGIWLVRIISETLGKALSEKPRSSLIGRTVLRAIPVHATVEQVDAYHLVAIEIFRTIIFREIKRGSSLTLANCIGLCSALVDSLLMGFFGAEAVHETAKLCIDLLNMLIAGDFECNNSLTASEQLLFYSDLSHFARLSVSIGMRISLSSASDALSDEDLQCEILSLTETHFRSLFLISDGKKLPTGNFPKQPSQNSKFYPIWCSSSLSRCDPPVQPGFPDMSTCSKPENTALAPLLVSLHALIVQSREDVRGLAISVLVLMLQHCQRSLGELLVVQIDGETIDVVNRGGFRALLAAHEAATIADNTSAQTSVKRRYASFFDWFDKNQQQIQKVFTSVDDVSFTLFPGLDRSMSSPDDAIMGEQQDILSRATSEGSSDRSLLGSVERTELAKYCSDGVSDSHAQWKRHGFDDLAYGAMKWKVFLRQSKGPFSLWEGGPSFTTHMVTPEQVLRNRENIVKPLDQGDFVKHWKLDLTEGRERQRRRLLPNHEFSSLYNIDEGLEEEGVDDVRPKSEFLKANEALDVVPGPQMEATTELLKDLNIKRVKTSEETEFDLDGMDEDSNTVTSTVTNSSGNDVSSAATQDSADGSGEAEEKLDADHDSKAGTEQPEDEQEDSSSYELISGLLQSGDKPEKCYNVQRCTGLEVSKAILLWCNRAIYVIDGFEQSEGDGIEGTINRVERQQSIFTVSLRPKDFVKREESDGNIEGVPIPNIPKGQRTPRSRSTISSDLTEDIVYQHRSQRISFDELSVVYRRRYQLQQNALEFFDTNNCTTLIAFRTHESREEILTKVLQSKLPNSIFNSNYGSYLSYSKFMAFWKSKVISQWTNGKMSNFDFLMHLNSFAGRTFNDLTQYPVFPWVIADYESEELNLDDPNTFRDLSKPMGAIGDERAKQFRDRYDALVSTSFGEDDPPPFHYGTHYSSAAYVLYYLIRLEPFSRLALLLQGGKFDVADRLFHDVCRSWKSASSENLQDVRELIPEFFYLPDFLTNTNHFDYGETQKGKTVHDVSLPPWAKGDPERFVRLNRQALESDYVSKHLHLWADLIFGFKQRGEEAIQAQNTFVHVTYEGEVNLDSITDPVERASIISQIQNFGQTPSRLERRPFPPRVVSNFLNDRGVDLSALASLTALTPPLCVVGAPGIVKVKSLATDSTKLGMEGQRDLAISDICLMKGLLVGVGRMCCLMTSAKKYVRFGTVNNGISVHTASLTTRHRELNKLLSVHDSIHSSAIVAAKASDDGSWIVTGSIDSTLRVWKYDDTTLSLKLKQTLVGHDGYHIKSIDMSVEFGLIVSAASNGRVLIWDLRSFSFIRPLHEGKRVGYSSRVCVSINKSNGSIFTLIDNEISVFGINGNLWGKHTFTAHRPTCICASDCPEWMEDGIVVACGHENGEVGLYRLDYDEKELYLACTIDDGYHSAAISSLRITSSSSSSGGNAASTTLSSHAVEARQDCLLVGDSAGRMSVYKVVALDSFPQDELRTILKRYR